MKTSTYKEEECHRCKGKGRIQDVHDNDETCRVCWGSRKVKVMVDPKLEIDVITGKITEREK